MLPRRSSVASLTAGLLAVVLVAAACGDGIESTAFEVNDRETTQSDFHRELDALADNEGFADLYEGLAGPVRNSEGTVSAQLAAEWATLSIQQEILADAIDDEGIEMTEDDHAEAEIETRNLFGGGEQADAIWEDFPAWFQDRVVDRLAAQVAYIRVAAAPPSDEEVEAFYQENLAQLVEGCESGKFVSHVLVESQEEADEVIAELDAGASFAALARERSIEPAAAQTAGFLDCFDEGSYVPAFEDAVTEAPVGATTAPIETEFGWHVIRVDAEPPLEGVRSQIEEALGGRVQQEAFRALLEEADVEVDARYGTWVVDEAGARVEPPEAAIDEPVEDAPAPGEVELPELEDLEPAPPPSP